jgi:DNA-binding SARP family transcriptional activator
MADDHGALTTLERSFQEYHIDRYLLRRATGPGIAETVAAPRIVLRLLDGFELTCGGQVVGLRPASQRLVALVALHTRPLLRSFVIARLWPETSERCAQHSLRTELYRLRSCCGADVVEATRAHLMLARDVAVDVHAQRAAVGELEAALPQNLDRELVSRFAGELLPGWNDEWVVIERERLRNRRLHVLEKLSAWLSRDGDHAAAIDAALAALAADPLRETAHRVLIQAFLAEGNRAEAERHWRVYRRLIRERFQLEPAFAWDEISTPRQRNCDASATQTVTFL